MAHFIIIENLKVVKNMVRFRNKGKKRNVLI